MVDVVYIHSVYCVNLYSESKQVYGLYRRAYKVNVIQDLYHLMIQQIQRGKYCTIGQLLAALIPFFFTMLIFVFVDPPAVWQNSWRGLDSLVVPQQRTFYQKNTGAVLLNVSSGPNSVSTSVNCQNSILLLLLLADYQPLCLFMIRILYMCTTSVQQTLLDFHSMMQLSDRR